MTSLAARGQVTRKTQSSSAHQGPDFCRTQQHPRPASAGHFHGCSSAADLALWLAALGCTPLRKQFGLDYSFEVRGDHSKSERIGVLASGRERESPVPLRENILRTVKPSGLAHTRSCNKEVSLNYIPSLLAMISELSPIDQERITGGEDLGQSVVTLDTAFDDAPRLFLPLLGIRPTFIFLPGDAQDGLEQAVSVPSNS